MRAHAFTLLLGFACGLVVASPLLAAGHAPRASAAHTAMDREGVRLERVLGNEFEYAGRRRCYRRPHERRCFLALARQMDGWRYECYVRARVTHDRPLRVRRRSDRFVRRCLIPLGLDPDVRVERPGARWRDRAEKALGGRS